MYSTFRKSGKAAGVIATRNDEILGCAEPDLLSRARGISVGRFGELNVQEGPSVHAGMELRQGRDFSATLAQGDFAKNLKLLPAPPALWAGRKEPLSTE